VKVVDLEIDGPSHQFPTKRMFTAHRAMSTFA
jgi:hypothetical protein